MSENGMLSWDQPTTIYNFTWNESCLKSMWMQHILLEHWHSVWISKAVRDFYPRTLFSPTSPIPNLFLDNLSKRSFHSPSYSSQQPDYHDSPLSWVPPLPNPSLSLISTPPNSIFSLPGSSILHFHPPALTWTTAPLVAPASTVHPLISLHRAQKTDHITLLMKSSHLFPLNWE